ncbi:MAG: T9SS C-terminal target domain-containing protein [Chitinophagaceae bacterium]|nr:MAG: T9SS C-terminal target domain-containing protein [Chitinophagaceae bacterium]
MHPWNPNANNTVRALALNGSIIYVGGDFTNIGGASRNRIAAIDVAAGNATAWDPDASQPVRALAVSGSTVYAGGDFTGIGGESRNRIAALDTTTGNATIWNPNANNIVRDIAVSGNIVYVGGQFTSIGGESRNRIAALDAITGNATAWNPNANDNVWTLTVTGSMVYAGGEFTNIGEQTRNNIAALDATTGAPTNWNPNAGSTVWTIAVSGSTVYAGGAFASIGGESRNRIAALDVNTGLATAWDPNVTGLIYALATDGSTVYAGGSFGNIGGAARSNIAALDINTGNATAWNPGANNTVRALAIDDNIIYAGGLFTSIGGDARTYIAALDATTGTPTFWNPNAGGVGVSSVRVLAIEDTTVYAGGSFSFIGATMRSNIAALELDESFFGEATLWDPDANDQVFALAVEGNTVYVGGEFSFIGGEARNNIAALDAITANATAWNPNANNFINALAVEGNTVYIGGSFNSIAGMTRSGFAVMYDIQEFVWTGAADTDWNNPDNWDNGIVPEAGSDIVIPSGLSNYPVFDGVPEIGGLTIENGVTITISNNQSITINGELQNNGSITIESGGNLVQTPGSALYGTGTFHVERFLPGNLSGYRLIASPILNLDISDINNFSASGDPTVQFYIADYIDADVNVSFNNWNSLLANAFIWDESASENIGGTDYRYWQAYINGTMNAGSSYFVYTSGDKTLTFSGSSVHNGEVNVDLSYSNIVNDAAHDGWNYVGNPYPSSIEWDTVAIDLPSGMVNAAYVFDNSLSTNTYRGIYRSYINGVASTPNGFNGVIAPGQGFVVKTTSSLAPGAQLEFNNAHRVATNTSFYKVTKPERSLIRLYAENVNFRDDMVLYFEAGKTVEFDERYDAVKMLNGTGVPSIYTIDDEHTYSIKSMPAFEEAYTIPLGVFIRESGDYTLGLSDLEDFPSTAMIYLEDTETNIITDLRQTDIYEVNLSEGKYDHRFFLHISKPISLETEKAGCAGENGRIILTDLSGNWEFSLKDEDANPIASGDIDGLVSKAIASGNYVIEFIHESGYTTSETIVIGEKAQVHSVFTLSSDEIYTGEEVYFNNASTGANQYIWDMGDGNQLFEENDFTYGYAAPGYYEISLIAKNADCVSESYQQLKVSEVISSTETLENKEQIKIYTIGKQIELNITEMTDLPKSITIYDATGREFKRIEQIGNLPYQTRINMQTAASGIYMIVIESESKRFTEKVVLRE